MQERTGRPEVLAAAGPRWLRLGIAMVLGFVAGATLFAGKAEGRTEPDRDPGRPPR